MKIIKKAAFSVLGAATLMMPIGMGVAHGFSDSIGPLTHIDLPTETLLCSGFVGEFQENNITEGCDLGIDKQVAVNGGAYAEADTEADAAQAKVGDTVTWQVTVTNTSDGNIVPHGILTVADVLPSGAAFDSYTASAGTYDNNNWTFDLSGNLPATLTITSHAVSTGAFKNTATLSILDSCNDDCTGLYSDSNPDNNSNDAWMDPSAAPQVLAESTLSNTGGGTAPSIAAAGLVVAALVVGLAGKKPKTES